MERRASTAVTMRFSDKLPGTNSGVAAAILLVTFSISMRRGEGRADGCLVTDPRRGEGMADAILDSTLDSTLEPIAEAIAEPARSRWTADSTSLVALIARSIGVAET